ncbi:MAG: biotin transporter BioY [Thermoleophilia bacterium]|nr:biotin transporter BioY [Gaiellaceae bacterium]MDW8339272.1 biotin transporter BioY [Thermoleophilia bacterium]
MTTATAALQRTLVPSTSRAADVAAVVAGAALIAASAQVAIPLPFTPVPITGQTFAVLLVGAALGTVRGGSSALLYVLAGALGAPVYAEGSAGLAVVTGPTGGYLVAFPLAASLVGRLAELRWDRSFSSGLGAMLCGNVLVYLVGLPWLAVSLGTGLERTLELGLYPFVPGDIVKLFLAAGLLPTAWRVVGSRRRRAP